MSNCKNPNKLIVPLINSTAIIRFYLNGGRVAEWSAHRTRDLGSSSTLASCWICSRLSPEFKSTATLVHSQLVAFCQLGFFNPAMLNLNYLFLSII